MSKATTQLSVKDQIREQAELSLEAFIRLVHPDRSLGNIHREVISWLTRSDAKTHQLLLLPRDHMKSALMAYRVAWEITRNPSVRILYISSTANLANKQLKFIKDILTCKTYQYYWPEMVNVEEGKREKWSETEISVDHPQRKEDHVRDPTVFTAGLTTSIVGLHCDIAVLDDVVIEDNAYSEDGRTKVRLQASYLASIASADGRMWVCGTRYHPKDLYDSLITSTYSKYDPDGNELETEHLYELFERPVEVNNQFLWPRQLDQKTQKWYGFNLEILSKKRAQYFDITKFKAQYYNNPNDESSAAIKRSLFQYYNKQFLSRKDGRWSYNGSRINVYAAVDFAFSLTKEADYTAIVVIGIDSKQNIYVLDIIRFKTKKISDYFDKILQLHVKWDFRKIRAEVTVAQDIIVQDLKNNYIRPYGLALSIDEHRPQKKKEDRIEAILQPRYNNLQMWHFQGGDCELLEEELVLQNPSHDDIKDALSSAIEIATPPTFMNLGSAGSLNKEQFYNQRFGGIG